MGLTQQFTEDTSGNIVISPLTNTSVVKAQLQDNSGTGISIGQQVAGSSLPVVLTAAEEAQLGATNETAPASDIATSGLNGRLQRIAQRLTSLIALFPSTLGQKAMANSFAVTIASDQASIPVTAATSGTATLTSVASSATSVSLLASSASRKGFSVFNDSTQKLYIAYGATASTSAFTVLLQPGAYYENNTLYTGAISGIWASANGNARVTELT
jgi:hypothetical protein